MSRSAALIGFQEAHRITCDAIQPLPARRVPLLEAVGQVVAEDAVSQVDVPSADASMKDGFAVISSAVAAASPQTPVRLAVHHHIVAGMRHPDSARVTPGAAVGVLTGAAIPPGADAVVANEFVREADGWIAVTATAHQGRNILPCGSDVERHSTVVSAGEVLTPGKLGLLVAAGHSHLAVIPRPKVRLIATGTEVVAPGETIAEGQVYSSNVMTIAAWCRHLGMPTEIDFAEDRPEVITERLQTAIADGEAVITSGGAWTSRKDLLSPVLERLGWRKCYHRIRMGPGKAVGMGILEGKPVFVLPGGPPSNLMAFLQLALPGLFRLSGRREPPLPCRRVRTRAALRGRKADWTQFIYGELVDDAGETRFQAHRDRSRLRSMAEAEAIAVIPEGREVIDAGGEVSVQMLGSCR